MLWWSICIFHLDACQNDTLGILWYYVTQWSFYFCMNVSKALCLPFNSFKKKSILLLHLSRRDLPSAHFMQHVMCEGWKMSTEDTRLWNTCERSMPIFLDWLLFTWDRRAFIKLESMSKVADEFLYMNPDPCMMTCTIDWSC